MIALFVVTRQTIEREKIINGGYNTTSLKREMFTCAIILTIFALSYVARIAYNES